jgi:hypothetical protein
MYQRGVPEHPLLDVDDACLIDLPGEGFVLRRPTLGDRVRARTRGPVLDRALACGARPETDVALVLRARRLLAPRGRRRLADALRHRVKERCGPQVSLASEDLLALAARLQDGAVDIQGVALVRVLLTDGAGPLHFDRGADRLVAAARQAAVALEP